MSNKVSLYRAAGSDLQQARSLARREMAVTSNVQDKWTRNEVTAAWRNILRYLDGLRKIPPNGLILFASSSSIDAIEPPVPCRANIYRCGSDFYRGPLDALYDEAAGPKTGLVLIDGGEATVGWFRGDTFVALWHEYSYVMPKHHKGGQSSQRFQRGREEQLKEWMRKVADNANRLLVPLGVNEVLVAGPAHRKAFFVEDGRLDYRLRVLGLVDCGYVDDVAGPREALARWRASRDQ